MTDKCPICLEELRSSIGTITPCGHCLHVECFQKLRMATKKMNDDENNDSDSSELPSKLPRCPVCKRKAKKFVNLYLTFEDKTNQQQLRQLQLQQQQSSCLPQCHNDNDDDRSCIPLSFDQHQRERSMSTTSIGTAGTLSSEHSTINIDSDVVEAVRNLTTENFRLQKSLRELKSLSRDQSELLLDIMPKLQHLESRLTTTSHEKSLIEKELRLVEDENSELISDWNNVELKLHMLQSEKNELQHRLHQSKEENSQLSSRRSIVDTKLAKAKRKRKRIESALQEGWMSQQKQAEELELVKDQIRQSRGEKEDLSCRLHQSRLETIRLKKEVKRLKKNKKQKQKQAEELELVKDQIRQSRGEKEDLSCRLHQSRLETIRLKKEVKRLKKNKKQKQKQKSGSSSSSSSSRVGKSKEKATREKPRSVSVSRVNFVR
eukprot:84974_1